MISFFFGRFPRLEAVLGTTPASFLFDEINNHK